MAIEAPYSKYRRQNCWIIIVICLGLAVWCAYDGYFNTEWIEEHKNLDGTPKPYLTFNRQAPFYLPVVAVGVFVFWFVVRGKKITAEEQELILPGDEKIPYGSIQKIDKTNFGSKGYFIVTYSKEGAEVNRRISNRSYDNLKPVLEHLVEKIS
jgi:hypothetical protein